MSETFTGSIEHFNKCRDFLQKKGYLVSSAVHVGDNKFEFEEDPMRKGLGCHQDYFKILAFIQYDKVVYRKVKLGSISVD